MNELQQDLEQVSQESNVNADIGITIDEDEMDDSDFDDRSGSSSKSGAFEDISSEQLDPVDEIDDNDWITAENFEQKLNEGLGIADLRL